MSVDDRLAELHIVIPETGVPVANYVTARRSGNLLFLSGHLGKRDGEVVDGQRSATTSIPIPRTTWRAAPPSTSWGRHARRSARSTASP